ncbi:MAG: hypothetical protein QM756_02205 [Polyangiaceae bacterium]
MRVTRLLSALPLLILVGCGADSGSETPDGTGGTTNGTGGTNPGTGGTTQGQGGASGGASSGGTSSGMGGSGNGGTANGGATSGGASSGGASSGGASTGGSNSGGNTARGGGTSGGATSGGASTGGSTARGGATSGGASSGGTASGGAARGGATSGGASSGGSGTGGATTGSGGTATCDFPDPPSNVSAWVNESWNAQLGTNVKGKKTWLLDQVMMDKGHINLCVRWGATSAVPETVKTNLETTIARWMNDWFKGLNGYGCFPYGGGITTKVTGWAVRPGKESLLGTVPSGIPVYTGVDGSGEPMCPDACSSFVHPDHKFTGCAAGADLHSDYWLWFDDVLPEGGAAAVGGDWGLRMPVKTFTDHFGDTSFMIAEHEIGHGFGIQDYYDWTGSRPTGGSIMIVGSTNSQPPTVADIWLLKRTWKEMKTLRGW